MKNNREKTLRLTKEKIKDEKKPRKSETEKAKSQIHDLKIKSIIPLGGKGKEKEYVEKKGIKSSNTERIENIEGLLNKKKWESDLSKSLTEFVKSLNKSREYEIESLIMYEDILNSFSFLEELTRFIIFYDALKSRKNPKYTAAGLLYLCLIKDGQKIIQKEISEKIGVERTAIADATGVLSEFLKKIPKYDFIFNHLKPDKLSFEEYNTIVLKYISDFSIILNSENISTSKQEEELIFNLFQNWFNSVESGHNFHEFIKELKNQGPIFLTLVPFLVFVRYYKDIDLSQKDFIEKINSNNSYKLNYSRFSQSYSEYISKFFEFDEICYERKVLSYIEEYKNRLIIWIKDNIEEKDFQTRCINSLNDVFIDSAMSIYNYALYKKQFEIIYIDRNNEIHYFFPQAMALSLLYYNLKKIEGMDVLATSEKFDQYFGNLESTRNAKITYRTITESTANRLYPFVKDYIGRFKGQTFTRKSFIRKLERLLKSNYHLETNFLLILYKMSNLAPNRFVKELGIYEGKLGVLIRDLLQQKSFLYPKTFSRIEKFIQNHIKNDNKQRSLQHLKQMEELNRKKFLHQGAIYNFSYFPERINNITDKDLGTIISNYLKNINSGDIPDFIFESKNNLRASKLYFQGTSSEVLKIETIKEDLIMKLMRENKILKYEVNNYPLCKEVQDVLNYYNKNKLGEPILSNILLNNPNTIAIEAPVWFHGKNSLNHFIGHIDLILFQNDTLIIADYKQDENEIFRSIPQICAYGIIIREMLKEYGDISNVKICCVGFSNKVAWVFNPDILKKEILIFIQNVNSKRNIPLLTKDKNMDLFDAMQKLKF